MAGLQSGHDACKRFLFCDSKVSSAFLPKAVSSGFYAVRYEHGDHTAFDRISISKGQEAEIQCFGNLLGHYERTCQFLCSDSGRYPKCRCAVSYGFRLQCDGSVADRYLVFQGEDQADSIDRTDSRRDRCLFIESFISASPLRIESAADLYVDKK